jgi:hypothetical protein
MEQITLNLNANFVAQLLCGFVGDQLIFVSLATELQEIIKMVYVRELLVH